MLSLTFFPLTSIKSRPSSPAAASFELQLSRCIACRQPFFRSAQHSPLQPRCALEPLQKEDRSTTFLPRLERKTLQSSGVVDPREWRTVPDIWKTTAEKYGDRIALVDPHHDPPMEMTFKQLQQGILDFSEGLRQAGISPDEKVALFADNSYRWLIADQGIMTAGAVNVVRGSRSSVEELLFIYSHSDSVAIIIDNEDLYNKLLPALNASSTVKFVVVLWGEKASLLKESTGAIFPVYTYEEFLDTGYQARNRFLALNDLVSNPCYKEIQPYDVATIVYTSGTTGNPKGVMLTHANLLHQVIYLEDVVQPDPGDRFLSLLPPWHMYERAVEYFSLARGSEQVYTNVKNLKEDLKRYPPHYMVSVPLVFETLYSGVQKELAASSSAKRLIATAFISITMLYMNLKRMHEGRALFRLKVKIALIKAAVDWLCARIGAALLFPLHKLAHLLVYRKILSVIGIKKAGISGGGSLPPHVDKFFEAIGITLLNGYGLTESSPVLAARTAENNVLGTVGRALSETEIKIVDVDSGETLPAGEKGLIKVRGPQVMKGYYKNNIATRKAIDKSGWLDTGDLGWLSPDSKFGAARLCNRNLVIDGRTKDTIVLSTGENIEPTVIEEAALRSRFIQQIMVIGQDQRRLGALIVTNNDELLLAGFMVVKESINEFTQENLRKLIWSELQKYTSKCPATIGPFLLLNEAFTVENGMLTPTMKIRRNVIASKYQLEIENIFNNDHSK